MGRHVPNIADVAPDVAAFAEYDEQHRVLYTRMLDADAEGADWREGSVILLNNDPDREPDRARRAFDTHLRALNG